MPSFKLDPFQEQAIATLDRGASVLVSAPTGTGKTVIADHVVARTLERGRQVIYTAPVKALSNQKFRDWCREHGEDKVGLLTGDLVIRRDAPLRVMTTEILRNMLLCGEPLPDLEAVILDEIHFLDDRERGTTWEEVLIYLPERVQILGLSATLSNIREFSEWLSDVRRSPVEVVECHKRAVPLDFQIFQTETGLLAPQAFDRAHLRWSKHHGKKRERSGEPLTRHVDCIDALIEADMLPCLYFAFSRKNTEIFARECGRHLRRSLLDAEERDRAWDKLADAQRAVGTGVLDRELMELYRQGIAYHHAGLHVRLKALVEELYEERLIKVLYCTSTFALGINMPARTVVFHELTKFDGHAIRVLTGREFMQKAGRAGRRGKDTVGHVVIRTSMDDWPRTGGNLEHLMKGKSEPVRSSFSLSFNSIANLLHRNPPERIRTIIERSFLNWSRNVQAQELDEEAERLLEAGGKQQKKADKLRDRARTTVDRTWGEFEDRVRFLSSVGYIERTADGRIDFNAGGRLLLHIQFEEIFVVELILSGLLEDIPMPQLFGLMCGVSKDLPRDARLRRRLSGPEADIARQATKIRSSEIVRRAEVLTGMSVTWCPEMILFGRMWAEGRSLTALSDLLITTMDITGDLVGAFRRAKDLISQLRDVYAEDEARADALSELMQKVCRDEVMVVD